MSSTHKLTSIWIGLLVITITGCTPLESATSAAILARTTPTATTSVISTEQSPSVTPTATSTPIVMQCVPQLLPVTDDAVSWVQWTGDGTTLYYNLQDDPGAWWAFDPASNTANPLPAKPVLKGAIPEAIAKTIPETVALESIAVSPNRENAVYGVEIHTLPTPTPDVVGESSGPSEFMYELFLVKSGADLPVSLGQFEGLLDGFTWFADSSAFLVHNSAREPGRAYTWLASVSTQTVTPLLVVTPDASEKIFVDLSEDGLVLLYRDQQTLHLYHLNTNTDQEILSLPNARFYAWFLDNTHILLVDDIEESLQFAAYIYDNETGALDSVGEATFKADEIILSPDKHHLTIVGMQSRELQILPICAQIQ